MLLVQAAQEHHREDNRVEEVMGELALEYDRFHELLRELFRLYQRRGRGGDGQDHGGDGCDRSPHPL